MSTATKGTVENESLEIGEVQKGRESKVKVRINTFKGKNYIDLRTFMTDKFPTTKGISLPIDKVGDLITLLEKAEQEIMDNEKFKS